MAVTRVVHKTRGTDASANANLGRSRAARLPRKRHIRWEDDVRAARRSAQAAVCLPMFCLATVARTSLFCDLCLFSFLRLRV